MFYYDRKADGLTKFSFPEIIPIEDEGFERNYAPLFRLYEYIGDSRGYMESRFLWGLYRHKRTDSKEFFELTFIFAHEKEGDRRFFSILKGLFEYRHVDGINAIKLFYVPWLIRWKTSSPTSGIQRVVSIVNNGQEIECEGISNRFRGSGAFPSLED